MTRLRAVVVVVAVGMALVLAGCTSSGRSAGPGYTPATDAELLAEIRALPHVIDVEMSSRERDFTNGAGYKVKLTTDGTVNPYLVVDETAAILRTGRERASLFVYVPNEDLGLGINDAYQLDDLLNLTATDPLRDRYGPQPGDGKPPAGKPVPTPPGWTPEPSPTSPEPSATSGNPSAASSEAAS